MRVLHILCTVYYIVLRLYTLTAFHTSFQLSISQHKVGVLWTEYKLYRQNGRVAYKRTKSNIILAKVKVAVAVAIAHIVHTFILYIQAVVRLLFYQGVWAVTWFSYKFGIYLRSFNRNANASAPQNMLSLVVMRLGSQFTGFISILRTRNPSAYILEICTCSVISTRTLYEFQ